MSRQPRRNKRPRKNKMFRGPRKEGDSYKDRGADSGSGRGGKGDSERGTRDRKPSFARSRFKSENRQSGPPQKRSESLSLSAPAKHTRSAIQKWLQPASGKAPISPTPEQMGSASKISLDPWQEEAFTLLLTGESVVVDAPTTAGKTRVVEAFFLSRMHEPGFRAAYTTPVKSLTNDKLLEFREMFGSENVGISTGDIKENLDAPIVVATLESYRNSLLGTEPDLGRNLVVFDEYHFMQDSSRGSAWEEAIILSPRECQILMLSASVSNTEDFVGWLERIRERPCKMVRTEHRPVPLVDLVYVQDTWLLASEVPPSELRRLDQKLMRIPEKIEELAERIIALEEMALYPCIIYAGRRLQTEILARQLMQFAPMLPEEARVELAERMNQIHGENQALRFVDQAFRNMLISYGIAYHHSGMAAPARVMVEKLLKEGKIRLCVATMGLSIGINFSVRSALIADYSRPDESGLVNYSSSEILQMRGRAGRRGRDQVGFSLWPNPESYVKFSGAKREACHSRLKTDPVTLLGLMGRGLNLREIENFYGKGFGAYQESRSDFTLIRAESVKKQLNAKSLPCEQPASEYLKFIGKVSGSKCENCPLRKNCHILLKRMESNPLTALQLHLLAIGAIGDDMQLSQLGNIARFFPQSGGMLIAQLLVSGGITEENLLAGCQLMAACSLAGFKSPGRDNTYRFPWEVDEIKEQLEDMYPRALFPDLYEEPHRGGYPEFREFNPEAGFAIKRWIQGAAWRELEETCTTERFGSGDLMNLIYRTATYLQSLSQASIPGISASARKLREDMLREPLTVAVFG